MEHFVIRDFDAEPIEQPEQTSLFHYDEGNWIYTGTGNIAVFAFEDEGEPVKLWVAEKRRTAVVDVMEELTYANLERAFAL